MKRRISKSRIQDSVPSKKRLIKKESRTIVKPIEAQTPNHKQYILSIVNNPVTICVGPAGTGKSYISAGVCSHLLHENTFDKLIVTRPLICSGKDIGHLPGEMSDKIFPYIKPMEENIKNFLGQANYGLYYNEGRVRYEPLELMRGATFDYSCMILDEAQNCTIDQLKMFITRIGKNSKVVINGDTSQTDLKSRSGLDFLISRLSHVNGVGICKLTYEDIQRNGIIGQILTALET